MSIDEIIKVALAEDITDPNGIIPTGDHSSLSSIPSDAIKKARLLVKQDGIIAGIELAKKIFKEVDEGITFNDAINDGDTINVGNIGFWVEGNAQSILRAERIVLNFMQRMSGIATLTNTYVKAVEGTRAKVLDTRKTTPVLRELEKWAVKIGGGTNHRFGLYDMIMLKDNHIDYCGGIEKALDAAQKYIESKGIDIKIEVETRTLDDVRKAMNHKAVDRIMLDNFSVEQTNEAVALINGSVETESSGGITLGTIRGYAECGVDYISVGALTHSVKSLDISLKAF